MLDIANGFSILTFGVSLGFRVSVCAEITSFPVATERQTAAESARELQKEIKTLDVMRHKHFLSTVKFPLHGLSNGLFTLQCGHVLHCTM